MTLKYEKEAIMVAISQTEAEKLHNVLDEFIGVFRYDNMPEDAVVIYNNKKEEFIEIFTKEVPENYWFQGTEFSSVNLVFHPIEGFKLVSELAHDHLKNILEKTNGKLKKITVATI